MAQYGDDDLFRNARLFADQSQALIERLRQSIAEVSRTVKGSWDLSEQSEAVLRRVVHSTRVFPLIHDEHGQTLALGQGRDAQLRHQSD
jgi:hypothetical protein